MPRHHRAYTQWTADTELAFILALRLHGHVGRALAEIGRTHTPAYDRRRRLPDFAAKWDDALDRWRRTQASDARQAAGLDDPGAPAVVAHHDGWTVLRRRAFLRLIGQGQTAIAACRHLGLSYPGACHLRGRDPAFAAAWERAVLQSAGVIEQVAFERAIDGVEEEVWHAGKVVGTRRRYSEPLMRQLIGDHSRRERDDAAAKAKERAVKRAGKRAERLAAARGAKPDPSLKQVSMEEVEAALLKNLEGLARGQRRAAVREAEAQAAAFRASWGRFGGVAAEVAEQAAEPRQDVLPPLAEGEEGPEVRLTWSPMTSG